jgi:hypothetical protein
VKIVIACSLLLFCNTLSATSITTFPKSVYTADAAALNAAVGVSGYLIEDFEDGQLLDGLSITEIPQMA